MFVCVWLVGWSFVFCVVVGLCVCVGCVSVRVVVWLHGCVGLSGCVFGCVSVCACVFGCLCVCLVGWLVVLLFVRLCACLLVCMLVWLAGSLCVYSIACVSVCLLLVVVCLRVCSCAC